MARHVQLVQFALLFIPSSGKHVCVDERHLSYEQSTGSSFRKLMDDRIESMDDGVGISMKFQLLQTFLRKPNTHDHYLAKDALQEEAEHEANMKKLADTRDKKEHLIAQEINKENQRHDGVEDTVKHMEDGIATVDPETPKAAAEAKEHQRHAAELHRLSEAVDAAKQVYKEAEKKEILRHDQVTKIISEGVAQSLLQAEKPQKREHYLAKDALVEEAEHEDNMKRITEIRDNKIHLVEKEINKENQRHDGIEETIKHREEELSAVDPEKPKAIAEAAEHQRHGAALHSFNQAVDSAKQAYEEAVRAEILRHDKVTKKLSEEIDD